MKAAIIHHRLDLLIRLLDTTTGYEVRERDVHFYEDEKELFPLYRGDGIYAFVNFERINRKFRVRAYGYEEIKVSICYENMDSAIPTQEIFLIPSEDISKGEPVISFTGKLSGISHLEAVSLEPSHCSINSFDERKRIMKLFKTRQSNMENRYYGLIHMEEQTYERFEVEKELVDSGLKIKEPLVESFSVNSPIARIIFGMVKEDGSYCIRVRDNRDYLIYLLRYVVGGEVKFRILDFRKPEKTILE